MAEIEETERSRDFMRARELMKEGEYREAFPIWDKLKEEWKEEEIDIYRNLFKSMHLGRITITGKWIIDTIKEIEEKNIRDSSIYYELGLFFLEVGGIEIGIGYICSAILNAKDESGGLKAAMVIFADKTWFL